jgi:predicted TIM-barrel fold metal-dependent hydrolase
MICDVHVHAFGFATPGRANCLCEPARRSRYLRRLLAWADGLAPAGADAPVMGHLDRWLNASGTDRAVILALDRAYRADGTPDLAGTRAAVDNDDVADWVAPRPRAVFGASVHPRRPDACDELDRLAARGACLVKWLPSAQNIAPDDPSCFGFYERLARWRLPLLTHTGIEHMLSSFDQDLNHPRRLRPALERGVTVIAAHCGTRMYLHERPMFGAWRRLAQEFPNVYGDLGAFGLPMHGRPLRRILGDPALCAKLVYGSDFPAATLPLWFAPVLGIRRALALRRIANPFDRNVETLRALGVPGAAFARGLALLRPRDRKDGSP